MAIPILRLFEVLPGREQGARDHLIGLIAWLRQYPEVRDARAFAFAEAPRQFGTWVVWQTLEARDQSLQSKHWSRRIASMAELLARPAQLYTSEVLLEQADGAVRGVSMLGLFRSRGGVESALRELLVRHGREIAKACQPVRICLGQAMEDRTRFFGLFESETLAASPAERLCACPHACLDAMARLTAAPIEWHRLEVLTETASPGVTLP